MADQILTRYERLTGDDIQRMRGSEQENHSLDFKLLKGTDFAERSDRALLGKAVSGFANSDGGLIIWGVDARKDDAEEGIDHVIATPGLKNFRLAVSRLNDLAGEATSPPVIGTQSRWAEAADGTGFALTYVPASDSGPHMCMLGGESHYYFARVAGRFSRLEHFQLADMFGRRARPLLDVHVYRDLTESYKFRVRITNSGRGAAVAPYIQIVVPPPFNRTRYGVDGNGSEALAFIRTHIGAGWLQAAGTEYVIHPTTSVELGGFGVSFPLSPEREALIKPPMMMGYKVGALGIAPTAGEK